jgi:hypothetical protein
MQRGEHEAAAVGLFGSLERVLGYFWPYVGVPAGRDEHVKEVEDCHSNRVEGTSRIQCLTILNENLDGKDLGL